MSEKTRVPQLLFRIYLYVCQWSTGISAVEWVSLSSLLPIVVPHVHTYMETKLPLGYVAVQRTTEASKRAVLPKTH